MDEKIDKIAKGIADIQKAHKEFSEKSEVESVETKTMIENIKKDISQTAKELQEEKQKVAAQKEELVIIQKEIIANGKKNNDYLTDCYKSYYQHFSSFLKKGIYIPEDELKIIYKDIVEKSMFGSTKSDIDRETKDLMAGSNADGGFFLSTDRSSTMSVRMFETSAIRPLADIQTTTSDVWEIILDDDEPDSGWVGEVTARPDTTTPQIGLIKIPIQELYAQPRATQKMIDDAGFDIASWLQGKITRKFARDENNAFVIGDGASKPKGFLTYDNWTTPGVYQRTAVEQIETAVAVEIAANDLIALQGSLFEDYQSSAQWAMSRETFFNYVVTLVTADGGAYLINPRLLAEGAELMLLGRTVNLFGDMPNVANNSLSIAYADWREFYTIVDRMGIRVLRDPYTAKPYVKFYTTKRVGAAVTNYEAGKLLKIKST